MALALPQPEEGTPPMAEPSAYRLALFERNVGLAKFAARNWEVRPGYTAEDIEQTALLGLWKAALAYQKELGNFSSYALRSIRNTLVDMCGSAHITEEIPESPDLHAEAAFSDAETRSDLMTVLAALPAGQRQLLVSLARGAKPRDIARHRGCTPQSIRVEIYRARRRATQLLLLT